MRAPIATSLALLLLVACHAPDPHRADFETRTWVNPGDPAAPAITEIVEGSCPGGLGSLTFRRSTFIGNPSVPLHDWQWDELRLDTPYLDDARLPADAVDSGYREGARELWTSPAMGKDAVFIVSPEVVQRWPRWNGGCA